jgi:hypothetical protein
MDPLVAALEQAGAEAVLDLAEHLADRGLAQVQPRGRAAHGARLGKRDEQFQVPQAQRADQAVGLGVHVRFLGMT